MLRMYLNNKDLYVEMIVSKAQGRLTRKAEKMLELTCQKVLSKKRYEIPLGKHLVEVDVFEGKLHGLIVAEIELASEDEKLSLPNWIIKDVSHEKKYLNVHLIEQC